MWTRKTPFLDTFHAKSITVLERLDFDFSELVASTLSNIILHFPLSAKAVTIAVNYKKIPTLPQRNIYFL